MSSGPEAKLYKRLKNVKTNISWNRLENRSLLGTPDLLGYNSNGTFFTLELKVTRPRSAHKISFSPHQISFHVKHPKNSFILVACSLDKGKVCLYPGSGILALHNFGLKLEPLGEGLEPSVRLLESL